MKVLLVDDDPRVAEDLALLLPPEVELMWAPGSEAALDMCSRDDSPDAVILDLCMPLHLAESDEHEGLQLISELQGRLARGTPVVVLSGTPREDIETECLQRGAQAYFEKPCVMNELMRALTNLIDRSAGGTES